MTVPEERTRAVLQARNFLRELRARADMPQDVRQEAVRLLRHYPDDYHVDTAAVAWPEHWSRTADEGTPTAPSYLELLAQMQAAGKCYAPR